MLEESVTILKLKLKLSNTRQAWTVPGLESTWELPVMLASVWILMVLRGKKTVRAPPLVLESS